MRGWRAGTFAVFIAGVACLGDNPNWGDEETEGTSSTSSTSAGSLSESTSSMATSDASTTGAGTGPGGDSASTGASCESAGQTEGCDANPPGSLLWSDVYHTSADDFANSLAVGPNGEVAVTGSVNSLPDRKLYVRLYVDFAEVWTSIVERPLNDEGWAIDFDGDGNIVVAGFAALQSDPTNRPYVARFDVTNGELLWEAVDEGQEGENWAIGVGPAGSLYVGGFVQGNQGEIARVQQYDVATGNLGWEVMPAPDFGSNGRQYSWGADLVVDGDVIYVGGKTGDSSASSITQRRWVLALDRATSDTLWATRIGEETIFSDDSAYAVDFSDGELLVAGRSAGRGFYGRFDPESGDQLTYEELPQGEADVVWTILGAGGVVYVGGDFTGNDENGYVHRVSDQIDWTYQLVGEGYDRVWDLAVGPDGTIFFAGVLSDAKTGSDAFVGALVP